MFGQLWLVRVCVFTPINELLYVPAEVAMACLYWGIGVLLFFFTLLSLSGSSHDGQGLLSH